MPKYNIGTAGWSYKDWVPVFYPKQQSGDFNWLSFYAKYFNCVEVNSTFYTYISLQIVDGWIKKIEETDDFLFTIKLHQDFTHRKLIDDEKIKTVIHNLEQLQRAERLGGLLIQFPYSFSFEEYNTEYISRLKEIFQNYNCFVEVRHKSWMNEKAMEFFKQSDLTYCTIDQPQIGESIPFEPVISNDIAYIRFHGRNEDGWKKSIYNFSKDKKQTYDERSERYKYLYSPGELVEIEQKIKQVQEKVKEVFIIMNNHPVGNAPANAFELIHHLEERTKINIPANMLKAFPRLDKIAYKKQNSLFD